MFATKEEFYSVYHSICNNWDKVEGSGTIEFIISAPYYLFDNELIELFNKMHESELCHASNVALHFIIAAYVHQNKALANVVTASNGFKEIAFTEHSLDDAFFAMLQFSLMYRSCIMYGKDMSQLMKNDNWPSLEKCMALEDAFMHAVGTTIAPMLLMDGACFDINRLKLVVERSHNEILLCAADLPTEVLFYLKGIMDGMVAHIESVKGKDEEIESIHTVNKVHLYYLKQAGEANMLLGYKEF